MALKKRDILALSTDGVVEARCDGDFYGEERLLNLIRDLTKVTARGVPAAIFADVMLCTGNKPSDDVGILTVSLDVKVDEDG